MISDEAVEAAARGIASANLRSKPWEELDEDHANSLRRDARAALEAAAPIMLSHERQLTADAHRDAIVNRDTADRLERQLEDAKAEAWDECAGGYLDQLVGITLNWEELPNPYRDRNE